MKENIIDNRFIIFCNFPWWTPSFGNMETDKINIKLFYITDDQIKKIEDSNLFEKLELNIKSGYIVKIKSKMLNCKKYINVEKEYFDKIYSEIYNMKFEDIVIKSSTGYDGSQFEITIGQYNGLNRYYKKMGLWSPPCTDDENNNIEINKLLEIYNTIKTKINFNLWYNDTLLIEINRSLEIYNTIKTKIEGDLRYNDTRLKE